jgi:hypothetical protein
MVREALVASVAWTLPPVSRHSRKLSMVPKASSPLSARRRVPHDRLVDRLAGGAVPDDDGFALIGNADGLDVAAVFLGDIAQGLLGVTPDILDIVFDPAGFGIVLREFLAGGLAWLALAVEAHRAGRGGALIECNQDFLGHCWVLVSSVRLNSVRRLRYCAAGTDG